MNHNLPLQRRTRVSLTLKASSPSMMLKVASMMGLLMIIAGPGSLVSRSQQARDEPLTVTSVSARTSSSGTQVSISANGSLNKAQSWQDSEGYHVVVPSAAMQKNVKSVNGIKLRQLDGSVEIVVQTKPGSRVSVQPSLNRLNLNVDGSLEPGNADEARNPGEDSAANDSSKRNHDPGQTTASRTFSAGETKVANEGSSGTSAGSAPTTPQLGAIDAATAAQAPPSSGQSDGLLASLFLDPKVLLVTGVGVLAFLFYRRRRVKQIAAEEVWHESNDNDLDAHGEDHSGDNETGRWQAATPQGSVMKSSGVNGSNGPFPQRKSVARVNVATPASLFGAYRVDQEVGKLVMGQAHRTDVLSSRAPEDRRAIETSLLKVLSSIGADEDEGRRAREALEEYGFVARQSALLLLAPDPYERTSAARMLGEIKSPAALPFLLEALYDSESIVRNQAVLSIGELKIPSAIGALLDIARKHSDVPGALLSRVLSSCSVEGLDFFDAPVDEPRLSPANDTEAFTLENTRLVPASAFEDLPESVDDKRLEEFLAKLDSQEIGDRKDAIKGLAQYAVRRSVAALANVARHATEANLRALAISSLASINHESVFPAVLIGMADETREVRAAAARSLSRLSFDRADAYVRVIETNDADLLRDVAQACIKAGIASQAIDRLGSNDRRHAYEALSLVSILAKANMIQPILQAITDHPIMDVRLSALHLLETTGHPAVLEQLRHLNSENMPDALKARLVDLISRMEGTQDPDSDTTSREVNELTEPEPQSTQPEGESSGLPEPATA
jgi:HEAT repeat protein